MGVSPKGFTQSELKKSYYTLSKLYHPDKNPDPEATEKFVQVKLGKKEIKWYTITRVLGYSL